MTANYAERVIDLTITLQQSQNVQGGQQPAQPTFAGTNANVVKITGGGPAARNGFRISAKIVKAGGNSLGGASIRIYNLPLSIMNQLSVLATPRLYQAGRNTVVVEAGDLDSGVATVFQGNIIEAWAEFTPEGDAIFNISAFVGTVNATAPAQSTTYPSGVSASVAMRNLAILAGYNFEDGGVNVQLPPMYLSGSLIAQIQQVASAANISYIIDDVSSTLAIWPVDGSRNKPIAEVSATTGLVGYPRYTGNGVAFRTIFDPRIIYGAQLKLTSILTPACGQYVVYYLEYDLECQASDGPWFLDVEATPPGFVVLSSPTAFN